MTLTDTYGSVNSETIYWAALNVVVVVVVMCRLKILLWKTQRVQWCLWRSEPSLHIQLHLMPSTCWPSGILILSLIHMDTFSLEWSRFLCQRESPKPYELWHVSLILAHVFISKIWPNISVPGLILARWLWISLQLNFPCWLITIRWGHVLWITLLSVDYDFVPVIRATWLLMYCIVLSWY